MPNSVFASISTALVLFFVALAQPAQAADVLFVANGYYQQEYDIYNRLQDNGHDVTVKKSSKIKGYTDLTPYDLIIVTEYATGIRQAGINNIDSSGKPLFIIEYWDFYYSYAFDMSWDSWGDYLGTDTVHNPDDNHFITEPFEETLKVHDEPWAVLTDVHITALKGGTLPLIYSDQYLQNVTVAVDDAKKRVFSGICDTTRFTDEGWDLFDRIVDYLLGATVDVSSIKPPRDLPMPPREIGCYVGTIDGWQVIPCTPSEDVNLPYPEVKEFAIKADAIDDPEAEPDTDIDDRPFNYPDAYEIAEGNPLHFGQVETTLVTYGGLIDDEDDSTTDDDKTRTVSVQLNTNRFWHESGDGSGNDQYEDYQAVIQFVIQTINGNTGICIWDINVYDAYQGINGAYNAWCLNGLHPSGPGSHNLPFRTGGDFAQFDYATIGASAYQDTSGDQVLGMVAQFTWGDPTAILYDPIDPDYGHEVGNGLYAVVAPDYRGLGIKKHWTDVSGDMIGAASSSQAVFTDSSVLTRVLAGSCTDTGTGPVPEIPWPGKCPEQPELWDAINIGENQTTAETSNLLIIGAEPDSAPKSSVLKSYSNSLVYFQYLASTDGTCQSDSERVFVRDTPSDLGIVPSNYAGEPFWESPDVFIVPEDTPVTVDSAPLEADLAPGETYDIYIRVHNDYGCDPVGGVKAKVYLADPSALSTVWGDPVTGDDYSGGPSPDGISVDSGSSGLIGPFTWTAPASVPDVHKCILASIISENQSAPGNDHDAPGSYQVAQRNVRFGECDYSMLNGTGLSGNLNIILTARGAQPVLTGGSIIEMTFDDPGANLYNAWSPGQGTAYLVSNASGKTTVRLGQRYVTLAPVPLSAGTNIGTHGLVSLVSGEPDTTLGMEVIFKDSVTDDVIIHNGASCVGSAGVIVL
ncbi:MAG: hypothetical protein GY847_11395 [Proteobacteria bacterium]|nr:hypothetical protein [Pseudomonadota bacterium]